MNKRFSYLIVALLCLLGGQSAWAQTEFTIGDLTYYNDGGYGNIVQVSAANTSISGEITIPAEVEYDDQTWSVELVKAQGFKNCQNITSVVINANLREICVEAFEKCYNLQSIKLPSTLTHIRFGAFYDCTSLKSLTIPSSVWIIERAAFYNTTALKNVVIEDDESDIQFWNSSENYNYGDANMFNSQLDKIYIGRSIWTETPGRIAGAAKEIETAGSFGDIPADFAKDNSYLTKVTLGGNIYSIGDKAFYHCGNLADVTITADVRSIGTDAFCGTGITNIKLPENLETIGYGAFYNCNKLESITIPSSVWAIYRAAFYGTDALKNVVIKDGESLINFYNDNYDYNWGNANMFDSEIEKIYVGRNIGFTVSSGKLAINAEEVEFGGNFGDVPAEMFKDGGANNYRLKKVTIGGVGTTIGDEAFFHCSNLAEINITAPIQWIGIDAFCRANKLTSITFPETVTSLNHGVVQNCEMLEYVFIPKSVTEMGRSVFYGSPLREVVIEDGEEPIVIHNSQNYDGYTYGDDNIFSSDVLQKIHLGRNIQMDEGKFVTHADEIELGVNVTSIDNLFSNTTGTTKVTAPWTEPIEIEADDFSSSVKSSALLLIPRGTADAYTTAGWGFANVGFDQYEVTLTATAGGNVKIGDLVATNADNNKAQLFDRETDVLVEIEKEQDYDFTSLTVNGGAPVAVVDGKYTIENLTEDKAVVATFTEKPKFTITATATGGTATASAAQVYRDRDAFVTFAANEGHELTSVKLNDVEVIGQVSDNKLTMTNIQANQNVVATFTLIHYTVSTAATENGTITLAATDVQWGNGTTATITPATGYDIDHVTINGENADAKLEGNTLTISNVKANTVVGATFKKHAYTVSAAATTNGTITLAATSVLYQEGTTATITPATGYDIDHVTINGENADAKLSGNTLTISNVTENITVGATFKKHAYTISKAATTNGTITLAATSVLYQENTTATITPASGYQIDAVTLNGVDAKAHLSGNTLTINNVTENIEVGATFKLLEYTVSITGAGVTADNMNPKHGENVTFTIAEDPDRTLTSFLVNSVEQKENVVNNQYTVNNVTGDITVVATFASTKEFITIGSLGVGTYACSQDLDFTGSELKAYIAVGFNKNTGKVLLSRVYDVPEGTGLYLIGEAGTYKIPYSTSSSYYTNLLKGNVSGENKVLDQVESNGMANYILAAPEGTPLFINSDGTSYVANNRAYLQVPVSFYDPRVHGVKLEIVFEEDLADGIEEFEMFDKRNNDSRIFNLNGIQLNKAGKGINIINGKKVLNK